MLRNHCAIFLLECREFSNADPSAKLVLQYKSIFSRENIQYIGTIAIISSISRVSADQSDFCPRFEPDQRSAGSTPQSTHALFLLESDPDPDEHLQRTLCTCLLTRINQWRTRVGAHAIWREWAPGIALPGC